MFSFSRLGNHGNLGNQLFEIAATVALAEKHEVGCLFPEWEYAKYFEYKIPQQKEIHYQDQINEPHYHFSDMTIDRGIDVDLLGWFQSEKYWKGITDVKALFKWDHKFKCGLLDKYDWLWNSSAETVAISVRRGDYVGNPNYFQLEMDYYLGALQFMPKDKKVIIFSDDIKYCKAHMPSSFHFMEGHNAIEQLCVMSMCDHFIIANSSFSWWGAYLGEKASSIIIAPAFWNAGELLKTANDKDVVPERWRRYNPAVKKPVEKIDLKDVTFTIPIKIDHKDREENLALNMEYLFSHFNTNVIIGEQDVQPNKYVNELVRKHSILYKNFPFKGTFERTRMLNEMAMLATTPIIVNWDADVFINPKQILQAVDMLRKKECAGVYPYDGRFFRCDRLYYGQLKEYLSVEIFRGKPFGEHQWKVLSYGGAIMWDKEEFIKGGMENQNMIHYGPEDYERYERFTKLGFKVERVKGPLFHLDHFIGSNGSLGHANTKTNEQEYLKVKGMPAERLRKYVDTWGWHKTKPTVKENIDSFIAWKSGEGHALNKLVERVYCINLKRRTDRKEHSEKQFARIGIKNVCFVDAIDGEAYNLSGDDSRINAGMAGCYMSHQSILKVSIDSGVKSYLVLEDDVLFAPGFNEYMDMALKHIPEDWEFIYLGYTEYDGLGSYKKKVNDFWAVPSSAWGTQAFMVRGPEAMKKLQDLINVKMTRQIDEQLSSILPTSGLKYYSLLPSMISQNYEELGSDIQTHQHFNK